MLPCACLAKDEDLRADFIKQVEQCKQERAQALASNSKALKPLKPLLRCKSVCSVVLSCCCRDAAPGCLPLHRLIQCTLTLAVAQEILEHIAHSSEVNRRVVLQVPAHLMRHIRTDCPVVLPIGFAVPVL